MRRIVAAVVLFAVIAQSSGSAALAASPGEHGSPSLIATLLSTITLWRASIMDSWLVAEVTGEGSAWVLMRERPVFGPDPLRNQHLARMHRELARMRAMKSPMLVMRPRFRTGVREIVRLPKAPPKGIVPDPRATRGALRGKHLPMPDRRGWFAPRLPAASSGRTPAMASSVLMPGMSGGPSSVMRPIQEKAQREQSLRPAGTPRKSNAMMNPDTNVAASDEGAGIEPWWSYQAYPVQGIGGAMVNTTTGNLVVQATDFDIHQGELDLSFTRTYNSQSRHDVNGDDGSEPALFGNGWTNNYDLHLVYRPGVQVGGTISIYDGTGARWDYTSDGAGGWTPPPGMQGTTLEPDSSNNCNYWWILKSGVAYYFRQAGNMVTCSTAGSQIGRLYEIVGRNQNNAVVLRYSFSGSTDTDQDITQIVVAHTSLNPGTDPGQQLTMNFAMFGAHNALSSITLPDQSTEYYGYYDDGVLRAVSKPGNNSATDPAYASALAANGVPTGYLTQIYGDQEPLYYGCGPRAMIGIWTGTYQGGCPFFYYDGSNRVTDVYQSGVYNFTPNDATNQPLQGQTNNGAWVAGTHSGFSYATGYDANGDNYSEMHDSNGHATAWYSDSSDRHWETARWNGSHWLRWYLGWDANNNLAYTTDATINTTDAGANVTNYGYDANSNLVEVVQPTVATSAGTFAPTSYFSYDARGNLTAYCDPASNAGSGGMKAPTDSLCANANAVTYSYITTDSNEPGYCLGSITTPVDSYTYSISYGGGCGYGLPRVISGQTINQLDGTTRTPTYNITYDNYGDVQSLNTGSGTYQFSYTALNQPDQVIDPDNVSTLACYWEDGSLHYTETAYQASLDGSHGYCGYAPYSNDYAYDPDGDLIADTHNHGVGAITTRFYDGLDRLVEVEEPYDATHDVYKSPWITRYLYDIGATDNYNFGGSSQPISSAYGNLFKIQELLPSATTNTVSYSGSQIANTVFNDIKGFAYDAMDRTTNVYTSVTEPSPTSAPQLNTQAISYDTGGVDSTDYGLPTKFCNALRDCEQYGYNPLGMLDVVTGDDARMLRYDPDGRIAELAAGNSGFSAGGEYQYSYDADGRIQSEQEPASLSQAASFSYAYYDDGLPEMVGVGSPALNRQNLEENSYRPDGGIQTHAVNNSNGGVSGWTILRYVLTPAGRQESRTVQWPGSSAQTDAQAIGYNAYGQVDSMTFPAGSNLNAYGQPGNPCLSLSSFTYSPDGDLTGYRGYSGTPNWGCTAWASYAYTVRGELATSTTGVGGSNAYYANGVAVQSGATWDDVMGAPLSTEGAMWGYDLAGRMTSETSNGATVSRSYDVENHLLATLGGYNSHYVWGSNGHPQTVAANANYPETLHWSGDQTLFTTNYAGKLTDIKVGSDGDILPQDGGYSNLTLYQRDPAGNAAGCDNAQYSTGFLGSPNPYSPVNQWFSRANSPCGALFNPSTGVSYPLPNTLQWWGMPTNAEGQMAIGQAGTLGMPRPDGMTTNTDFVAGVRAYDAAAGIWETPDFYPPNLMNPGTLKSYVWNGNNPIANVDPSGYTTIYCITDPSSGACAASQDQGPGACLPGDQFGVLPEFSNPLNGTDPYGNPLPTQWQEQGSTASSPGSPTGSLPTIASVNSNGYAPPPLETSQGTFGSYGPESFNMHDAGRFTLQGLKLAKNFNDSPISIFGNKYLDFLQHALMEDVPGPELSETKEALTYAAGASAGFGSYMVDGFMQYQYNQQMTYSRVGNWAGSGLW